MTIYVELLIHLQMLVGVDTNLWMNQIFFQMVQNVSLYIKIQVLFIDLNIFTKTIKDILL